MIAGFRDLLAWLMPWRGNYTPYPVNGPYAVAVAQTGAGGSDAASLFVSGATAGQAHEH